MATTTPCTGVEIRYKGDGRLTLFTFPFTYLQQEHIFVSLWDDTKKEYIDQPTTNWKFANPTTIEFLAPPPPPPAHLPTDRTPEVFNVRISRRTNLDSMEASFYPGSAIRANDLNEDFDQLRLAILEARCQLFGNLNDIRGSYWNKYSISNVDVKGETITKYDQRVGKWSGNDLDNSVATSDAISARLDPYVQDGVPVPLGLPEKEQAGKQWFDTVDLVQRFWDADAAAWVTLANTGPQGPPGPNVFYGTSFPPEPNAYGLWFDTNRKELRIKYNDGTGIQWVAATTNNTPTNLLIAGNGVAANSIQEIQTIDQGVI